MRDFFESHSQKTQKVIVFTKCQVTKHEFETFPKTYSEELQICRHQDGILTLTGLLNNLVVADRQGNWERHLQVIQIPPPFFNVR